MNFILNFSENNKGKLSKVLIFLYSLLFLMQSSFAFLPAENPTSSVGIDFMVPLEQEPVYLVALYNSTKVEFDYNGDGVSDESVTLNRSDTLNKTDLPASSYIHASKPIVAIQKEEWHSGCTCNSGYGIWGYSFGFPLPKTSELATEYYVANSFSEIYITAAYSGTTIQIDKGNDGSWDITQALPPGTVYSSTSLSPGDKISANRPIAVVQRKEWHSECSVCINSNYAIWGYSWGVLLQEPSTDYFVPLEQKPVYIVALNDSTLIQFDYWGVGQYDSNVTLNKSDTLNKTDLPASSHIHANKPILVIQKDDEWKSSCSICNGQYSIYGYSRGFILPRASELGTEYYVANPSNTIYITATYSNTTIQIDEGNDGSWDINQTLLPGVIYNNSNLSAGDRIIADKPIVVTQRASVWDSGCWPSCNRGRWGYSWAFLLKSPSLETTQEIPGVVQLGSTFSITTKILNPTETSVTDIQINLTYPSAFNLTSNVTVTKYNLTTDAVISVPTNVTFSQTCNGGDCVGTVNQSSLNPNEYLVLEYKLRAPSTPAIYSFDQVETSYTAETWLWGF